MVIYSQGLRCATNYYVPSEASPSLFWLRIVYKEVCTLNVGIEKVIGNA